MRTKFNKRKERASTVTNMKESTMTTPITSDNALLLTLDAALSLCRPHGSREVATLSLWLMERLPEHLSCSIDAAGNVHIDARTSADHRTLFIAHLDTVHRTGGANKIDKTPHKWSAASTGQCLGADDGGGVAMLMHLMHNGVPGYYIFSQGEECGGIGAKFLAEQFDATLLQFDRAIAFDRKGIDSVITHQGYGRCCSDEFAQTLADALNTAARDDLFLAPDDTGIYTDTAEFTLLIPECTNISIGYEKAHSDKEWIDMDYLQMLAAAAVRIDWDALPTTRDPSEVEPEPEAAYAWGKSDLDWSTWVHDAEPKDTKDARTGYDYTVECVLHEALDDAMEGRYKPLIDMMAEHASPQDPSIAAKQINRNRLTIEVLAWAEDQLYQGDSADQILDALFAGAYMH